MPIVSFASLPAESRVWVFGSDKPLEPDDAARLLSEVDRFLAQWRAHGVPLTAAREWRENRFLTIGVDTTQESASGCSIDGLFRSLAALERQLGVRLLAGGRVFYRDARGEVRCVGRDEFSDLAARAEVADDTPVFDTSITSAGDWRARFEAPAREAWVRELLRA
jgi:hypothetical protein